MRTIRKHETHDSRINAINANFQELNDAVGTARQYSYYTDPATSRKTRTGVRDVNADGVAEFVTDRELTETGFSGAEGVDWENLSYSE